ncbi:MAG TPA: hypothetical protein VIT41_09125 [Microlunatus sp.]
MDFELSRRSFDPVETAAFSADLLAQGADASLLRVWSATLSAEARLTHPVVLRARRGGRTVGAALLMICHDWGRSFFGRPVLRRAARLGPPIWYWERTGLGTDAMACPGVVVPGEDREAFVRAALAWLEQRFLLGCVLTPGRVERSPRTLPWPGLGISTLQAPWDLPALLARHRNLSRKVRKFGHRDGTISRIHGPLPPGLRAALLATYDLERPLNPPYIELYPEMVSAHWALSDDRLVHLVALLADRPVGYHSFWRTGERLVLLSGALGRPPGGTVHAYENLLLASVPLAANLGCRIVEYGATVNHVKASLLDTAPSTMLFVSRWRPLLRATAGLLPRSALAQDRIAALTRPKSSSTVSPGR